MERKTILALLLGLSVFSVFSIGYCSNGPLVYEMDFKNDKFYQSSDRGVLNEFYLYLPADTPQPGKYEFMPLGRGKKHYINSKSNLKIRNYSIKVWYEVWVSDNPSDRTVRNDNTPFFKIYSCNTEGEISDKPIVEEKFYNGRRQGNFILEKDKGFFIILNTGKWYHHYSQFARGYRSWYKITYQLDTTAPNAPAVDRIEVNGKSGVIRDQDNNTIYTNNDPIVLIWEAPKDLGTDYEDFSSGPSGVKDYLVYKDGNPMERQGKDDWVTTPQYEFSSLAEGKYKIQIKARDNENNESRLSDPIYLEVDRSVGLVSFADNPIEFSLTGSQKTVTAHWKELDDACGIKEYQVQLRQKNSSGAYDSLEEKKGGMLSQPFTTNLSSRYLYQIRVRAVDNLGNIGNWRNTADFSPPPSPAEIISVEPIAKIINDDKPSYQVKLTLEDVDAAKYVVERQNVGSSTWEKLAEISYNDLREANFEFIDTSVTKHGKYIYRVYTKNVLDHTSEYRSTNEQTIPNIPAEFAIIGPENNTYTNQTRWTIDINPKVDIEGDEIRFRVGYQPTGGNPQYIPDNMQTQAIEVEFPEGEGEWWVETAEYVDENEIPGSRQSTYNHSRSITIDFGFPDGGFELAPNLTNNQNIKLVNIYANDNLGLQELLFWNGTVEDRPGEIYRIEPAGEISEDILDKVAAGTAGISIAVSGTEVRIAEAIPWRLKDQDGKQEIAMEIRDRAGNSSNENPERDPVIRTVFLDRTPPSPPEEIQYRHAINAEGDPVIVFTVKAKKPDDPLRDIEKFTGICTLPDGTGISIDDNNISYTDVTEEGERYLCGTVEIKADPEEIGFNKQVTIAVASLDAAGNRSAEKPCYAWTLPKLGALARDEDGNVEAEAGYDWSTKKHYIRFKLQDQGEAAYHLLEAGETGEVGFPDVLTMGEGNFFTHNERNVEPKTNLTPRGKYKYRLVAVNDGGDRVYGDEFHYTLPNFPPGAPVPETPVGYARDYVEFRFTGVTDPDGDPVNYKVYIAEGTGPFTEVEPTVEIEENDGNLEEKVKFAIDKLSHGQTYAWYVEAYDEVDLPGYEQGITASETVWFTVDTAPPVLTIQDTMDNYTNLKQLTVTVSDALSGVKELSYQMLSVADNSVVKAGTIAINSGGGEEATRSIPLPEGRYHLQLSVEDRAGNRAEQNLNNLYVDYTAPEIDIANTGLLLQPVNGKYMVGPNFIPVKITAADGNSGLHRLRYWFTGIDGKDGGGGEIGLSPNINQYTPYLHMTGENGKEYDLEIQVTDRAGNESPVTKIGRVLLDRTAPEVSLTLTGLIPYNGKYYLGAIKDLKAELTTVDPESGIKEVLFAIREPGGSESGWGDWEKTKSHITTTGAVYQVGVKAINGAGSETIYYSEEFIYDNDAPEILAVNIPSGELVSGETAIIGIEAVEADSPITEYRLAVGNQEDPTLLTGRIKGNRDGWIILSGTDQDQREPVEIRFEIPEIPDGAYTIKLEVENAAGHKAAYTQGSLKINNKIEKIIVGDQGPYSMFGDRLAGWWRYNGEKEITGYRYRILDAKGQAVTNWAEAQETERVVEGLDLLDGETYHFEVQAVYKTGGLSASGKSPGVTIDTTPPVLTGVETPEYSVSKNIKFEWSGYDNESGISRVEAALSSSGYGQTDLTGGWVEVTGNPACLTMDIKGERLRLNTGDHCYLTVRIINGAGLISEERAARAIIIDDTEPPEPLVIDQGVAINTKQPLQAHWIFSPVDPESGNAAYQWTLLKGGESLADADWQDGNENMRVRLDDFQQQHGEFYYFAVKVTNGAGLSTIGMSDGILVDGSLPYIPEVRLVNAVNLGEPEPEEVNYITSNEGLGLVIYSYDPETEMVKYLYTWGVRDEVDGLSRTETEENLIHLSDPELPEGEIIVFLGEGINQAELVSPPGYSTGVILDTQAPKVKNVRGTYSGGRLLFDWEVEPSVAPVAGYEVSLVEAGKAPATWENVGLRRSIELDASDYPDGEYQLIVRAYNRAGTYSRRAGELDEWGTSPVIPLDRTAPEITGLLYNRYVSKELEAVVQAEDNLSGVTAYQYALGDRKNQTAFTGGWVEVPSSASRLELGLDTEKLPHAAEIYLAVRAKDRVGLWSEVKVSEKIIVDHIPPSAPVVTSGAYTTSDKMIEGIGYESQDPESGVTHYLLSVVKAEGGEWLTAPEPRPIEEFNGTLTGLNLEDGGQYRLVMRTMNGAGLWSEPGYSAPITVDITPPVLVFNREAEKNGELVFNLDELPGTLIYTLSEDAQVTFTLKSLGQDILNFSQQGVKGSNSIAFGENTEEHEYTYGTYTLTARPVDPAGNMGEEDQQQIRINTPPVIYLQAISTTPGKPLPLQQGGGYVSVSDPDGQPVHYEWNMGDGSGPKTYEEAMAYYYSAPGDYRLRLTVTDDDGGVRVAETTVYVRNTSRGSLYIDETWSGTHHLYGEVIVPENVTLTIEPGARIVIERDPAGAGYDYALIIKGTLIIPGGEVVIGLPDDETGLWRGIYTEGRAELNGVTIKQARRGLTALESSTVTVTGCVFRENEVGLHAYGSSPRITGCFFLENTIYGIKEDKGEESSGRPVVIDCRFGGNRYDYYHQDLAVITLEELNGLEGNQGNGRQ